jgi:hypothetical protein
MRIEYDIQGSAIRVLHGGEYQFVVGNRLPAERMSKGHGRCSKIVVIEAEA